MSKVFLFTVIILLSIGCSKNDENEPLTDYPQMSDPDDVCSAMDDIEFMRYCYENFDVNKDGKVSPIEAQAVTTISFGNNNTDGIVTKVKSLKGIQYFTNLTTLECNMCILKSLDTSKNTKLTSLKCMNCALTELDLSQNKGLIHLECGNDYIINEETLLESLNTIQELNLSNNTNLQQLNCERLIYLTNLNISNNKDLKILNCSSTSLSELDISNNSRLEELYCSSTIKFLKIVNNIELKKIDCSYSELTNLDISNAPKLEKLNCSNTKLTSLDISKCANLKIVYCYSCPLSSITVRIGQDPYAIFDTLWGVNIQYVE